MFVFIALFLLLLSCNSRRHARFVSEMLRLYTRCNLFKAFLFVYDDLDRHTKGRSTPSRFFVIGESTPALVGMVLWC